MGALRSLVCEGDFLAYSLSRGIAEVGGSLIARPGVTDFSCRKITHLRHLDPLETMKLFQGLCELVAHWRASNNLVKVLMALTLIMPLCLGSRKIQKKESAMI